MRKRETLEKFENLVELVKEETKDIAQEIVRQSDTFDDALKTRDEYYYDEESGLYKLVHAEILYQMAKKETGYK